MSDETQESLEDSVEIAERDEFLSSHTLENIEDSLISDSLLSKTEQT